MFSSWASLLPSALHINTSVDLPRQTVNSDESNKEDQENAYDVQAIQPQPISDQDQQNPAKGKERDAKTPSEVCCLFPCCHSQSGGYEHQDHVYKVSFSAVLH
jgi:hypothetical protein